MSGKKVSPSLAAASGVAVRHLRRARYVHPHPHHGSLNGNRFTCLIFTIAAVPVQFIVSCFVNGCLRYRLHNNDNALKGMSMTI